MTTRFQVFYQVSTTRYYIITMETVREHKYHRIYANGCIDNFVDSVYKSRMEGWVSSGSVRLFDNTFTKDEATNFVKSIQQ